MHNHYARDSAVVAHLYGNGCKKKETSNQSTGHSQGILKMASQKSGLGLNPVTPVRQGGQPFACAN